MPKVIVGFDPGRDKCGVAVMGCEDPPSPGSSGALYSHAVIPADAVAETLTQISQTYTIAVLVMGNQTTAKHWQSQVAAILPPQVPIQTVDERYSTLEARDRYWQMYPPKGLARLIPQALRTISRPLDDIAAIILIERYLAGTPSP